MDKNCKTVTDLGSDPSLYAPDVVYFHPIFNFIFILSIDLYLIQRQI